MRYKKIFTALLAGAWTALAASCATGPEERIDSVYVMVYDQDGAELMNAKIVIDGKEAGRTDIYGRFMLPCDGNKIRSVRAGKDGYESVETNSCLRPGEVLYFRLGSGAYYAEAAERLLDAGEAEKALMMIGRALEIQERSDWSFLREVILRRTEK